MVVWLYRCRLLTSHFIPLWFLKPCSRSKTQLPKWEVQVYMHSDSQQKNKRIFIYFTKMSLGCRHIFLSHLAILPFLFGIIALSYDFLLQIQLPLHQMRYMQARSILYMDFPLYHLLLEDELQFTCRSALTFSSFFSNSTVASCTVSVPL